MDALKCHFTRALISVMGVNQTVEINENKIFLNKVGVQSSNAR